MKLAFFGAAGMVTGSCFQVTCGKKQFLVDCGMFQGSKAVKELNYREFPFSPAAIDFVLVTHAHIDHTGLLPKLVKKGFKGLIFATEPSIEMMKCMLPDSARIQETEVERKNRELERKGLPLITPIYSIVDADQTISHLRGVQLGKTVEMGDGIKVCFRNAGHVFGSSFIEIWLKEGAVEKKVVFSGDLGGMDHPIVKDPEFLIETDTLIIESTYGNRKHNEKSTEKRLQKLAEVVHSNNKAGGNLIIPAFAFERTQDLMHDLLILMDEKKIPVQEIWIDSPLAVHATEVFSRFPEFYDEQALALMNKHDGKLFNPRRFHFSLSVEESKALNLKKNVIILSASGMCDAGRIKHHLKNNLWKPENTVLFVGYQAEGTLGRLLLDGAETIRIHGEEIRVEARIDRISGYSGHADQDELMAWVKPIKEVRDRVFVVHGEDAARVAFAKLIEDQTKFRASIPQLGEVFDLVENLRDKKHVVVPPKTDSFNLFAQFSLRLAEFMRRETDEEKRQALLQNLLKNISN
jgi:metallo-beta-lactamase family protein